MKIPQSELILNPDGSIYHLGLLPHQLAPTIITVGDPERVKQVSSFFDKVEIKKENREFVTHTGYYKNKRLTVISTGIGTDNVDIVINELDALFNFNFITRTVQPNITPLTFIRIGTSGGLQPEIPLDSFVVSEIALGFDNLYHFYENKEHHLNLLNVELFNNFKGTPYIVSANQDLYHIFYKNQFIKGFTATCPGFYGPQGRVLRLPLNEKKFITKLQNFKYKGAAITNLEMETSGIYTLAQLLNHRAISLNAILANRALGTFSKQPQSTVNKLIEKTLEIIVDEKL